MADKKNDNQDNANDPYLGRDVDSELVRKVDEYMRPENSQPVEPSKDKGESVTEKKTENDSSKGQDSAASAPLLPDDKLPTEIKSKPTISKIQVIDHSEIEDEKPAPLADEPQVEAELAEEPKEDIQPEPAASETEEDIQAEPTANEPEPEIKPPALDPPLEFPAREPEPVSPEKELGLEDVGTSKAVDEIVAAEADQVLAAEDRKHETVVPPPASPSIAKKLRHAFGGLLRSKVMLGILAIGLLAAILVPQSRYFVLNAAGVRSSTSMTVLDEKTGQPLKNVELSLAGQSKKTDSDGYVKLEKIELGSQNMVIKKPAFAEINRQVTIGWGSNPLGEFKLTPVGSRLAFTIRDFLSDNPISKAEASSGVASAVSNSKGELVLTVPETEKDEIEVKISAGSYRTETVKLPTAQKEKRNIKLVPGRKHAFISKRSGTFDVYKVDADGKNEEKVLGGSGSEREDTLALASHPDKNFAALVSTREGMRNRDGFILSTLTLIDLDSNETKKIGRSERVQLIDFVNDRLVFVKIAEGASAADPQRHRLISYDIESGTEKELASTNYFNDVLIAKETVYFSPALYKVNGSVGLFEIKADGSGKKTVYNKEVWNLFRTSHEKISVSVGQDWYDLNLTDGSFTDAEKAPAVLRSRVYADSPDQKNSLWVDERDGKGTLLKYDIGTKQDKVVQAQSGLRNPISWLSKQHIIYRISNDQETADYVLNIDGGAPKKIKDVTNTVGIDRWYYH